MDQTWEIITSQDFMKSMYWLGVSSFMLAVGLVVCAFAFYGRAADVVGTDPQTERWTLLMGTWRDSLIITLLFVSEALFYRFGELIGLSQILSTPAPIVAPIVQTIAGVLVMVLIFAVAILRIILITRWLSAQARRRNAEA